jgi:hypothetical protein
MCLLFLVAIKLGFRTYLPCLAMDGDLDVPSSHKPRGDLKVGPHRHLTCCLTHLHDKGIPQCHILQGTQSSFKVCQPFFGVHSWWNSMKADEYWWTAPLWRVKVFRPCPKYLPCWWSKYVKFQPTFINMINVCWKILSYDYFHVFKH